MSVYMKVEKKKNRFATWVREGHFSREEKEISLLLFLSGLLSLSCVFTFPCLQRGKGSKGPHLCFASLTPLGFFPYILSPLNRSTLYLLPGGFQEDMRYTGQMTETN